MAEWKPITGFDEEAWNWIVQDARAKLAWAQGKRPKVPRAVSEKGWRTRRANQARREREREKQRKMHFRQVSKENHRALQEAWRARGHAKLHVLNAMEPGGWYAAHDLAKASGVPYRTIKTLFTYRHADLVRRVDNPDYIKIIGNQYTTPQAGEREPMHLYGLTEVGLEARAEALQELAALGWPKYAPIEKDRP